MTRLVTVVGGSGFLGRYVVRRLAREGCRIRVAVRRPEEAGFLRPAGHVGQVQPVFCNIRDDASLAAVLKGAEAVVNCVGTFDASGRNSFEAVHVAGAGRIARIARDEGVSRMVQVSAIGASAQVGSAYGTSKAAGEAAVLDAMPSAVIVRPSILFGVEDNFFNRFATMASRTPVLPLIGAGTRFQPAWVDDVAQAVTKGATGEAAPGIYELGGPEVLTFREMMERMLAVIQRRRLIIGLPFWAGSAMARGFGVLSTLTAGLAPQPVTLDQVRSLRTDNVVADGAAGFGALGIEPVPIGAVLPDYLWRFRSSGQYAAIKDSARNLRS